MPPATTDDTKLIRMPRQLARRPDEVPWLICAASLALTMVGLFLFVRNRTEPGTNQFFDPVMPALALSFPAVGAFVASRRPENPVGWILCGGALLGPAFFAEQYAVYTAMAEPGALPAGSWMGWLGSWLWIPGYLALWTLLPLLFPDGQPPSARWRPVLWVAVAVIAVATVLAAFDRPAETTPSLRNPVGVDGLPGLAGELRTLAVLVLGPVCAAGLVSRWRLATGERRPQIAPVALAFSAALAVLLGGMLWAVATRDALPLGVYQTLGLVTLVAIPVAVLLAVVRDGLYRMNLEIDVLVNHLLVYTALAVVCVAAYWAVVSLLSAVIPGRAGLAPSLVAIVAVASIARRMRDRLRRAVDRLLYRKRQYDYRVFTALGECFRSTLGPDAVLSAIVETIASGLKLPYVHMSVGRGVEVAAQASHGQEGEGAVDLALVHQGELVGHLTVSPRTPEEPFDAADRRLLEDLAGQCAVMAYALCLTADLQRSRERLVTAQEEERRRLRRDLHDGLQPALAGVSLGLDAVRNIIGPASAAEDLLARLKSELENAGADVRRLVYDLRPPALDELGLVGALRQHASRFNLSPDGPHVLVEAPDDLHGLSAAVEVAAYRIGQEAMENVRKHSHARRCELSLELDGGHLEMEVRDDGVGVDEGRDIGVGLVAMQERAAEVGGSCSVESVPGWGTCVRARFPLDRR